MLAVKEEKEKGHLFLKREEFSLSPLQEKVLHLEKRRGAFILPTCRRRGKKGGGKISLFGQGKKREGGSHV